MKMKRARSRDFRRIYIIFCKGITHTDEFGIFWKRRGGWKKVRENQSIRGVFEEVLSEERTEET